MTLIYSAIPCKNLQARGAVHYQHQNPLDNQQRTTKQTKSISTINAYINIKMTKKARMRRKKAGGGGRRNEVP